MKRLPAAAAAMCAAIIFCTVNSLPGYAADRESPRPYFKPIPLVNVSAGGRAELDMEPFFIQKNSAAPVRYLIIAPSDCPAGMDGSTAVIEPADYASGFHQLTVSAREIPCRPVTAVVTALVLPAETTTVIRTPAGDIGAAPGSSVSIAGSFNDWNAAASPLEYAPETAEFYGRLPLPPGEYPYKLVIDDRWIPDPANPRTVGDGFGGTNSLIEAGTAGGELTVLPLEHAWKRTGTSWTYRAALLVIHSGCLAEKPEIPWITAAAAGPVSERGKIEILPQTPRRWRVELLFDDLHGSAISFTLAAALPPGLPYIEHRWTACPGRKPGGSKVLYFAMTDRFRDGDSANNRPVRDAELPWIANYQGGDFAGLIETIEDGYFNRLGVDWIWISPVVSGPDRAFRDALPPHRKFSGYHGYWPVSLEQTDPRFGTMAELVKLVETAHRNGLRVMLDAVFNHVHENAVLTDEHPDWFVPVTLSDGIRNIRRFDERPLTTWFDDFLPSFNYPDSREARSYMIKNALYWIEKTGVDGFRLDAVKHIPRIFWEEFRSAVKDRYPDFLLIGETISGRNEILRYVGPDCLDGQFDFPLYFSIRTVLAWNRGTMTDLEDAVHLSEKIFPSGAAMSPLAGNHDFARFTAFADGDIMPGDDEKEIGWTSPPHVDKDHTYHRLKMAFGLIMTLPGYPLIYYGDEYGMSGAGDPDNRRVMRFDPRRSRRERDMADFVARLCRLRKRHTALRNGTRWPLHAAGDILAYARYGFGERFVVVLNRAAQARDIILPLPPGFGPEIILHERLRGGRARAGNGHLTLQAPPLSISIFGE